MATCKTDMCPILTEKGVGIGNIGIQRDDNANIERVTSRENIDYCTECKEEICYYFLTRKQKRRFKDGMPGENRA